MTWATEVLNLKWSPPINDDEDADDGVGGGADAGGGEKILERCEPCFGNCDVILRCNHNLLINTFGVCAGPCVATCVDHRRYFAFADVTRKLCDIWCDVAQI